MHEPERVYRESGPQTLTEGEDLVAVIRGHLWIEFLLNTALMDAMQDPSQVNLDRMSFPSRVDLAVALGILSREEGDAYGRANSLRNRFAHDPSFQLDDESVARVWDSIPAQVKAHPDALYYEAPGSSREVFVNAFLILMIHLESAVTHLRDERVGRRSYMQAVSLLARHEVPKGMTAVEWIEDQVRQDRERREQGGLL